MRRERPGERTKRYHKRTFLIRPSPVSAKRYGNEIGAVAGSHLQKISARRKPYSRQIHLTKFGGRAVPVSRTEECDPESRRIGNENLGFPAVIAKLFTPIIFQNNPPRVPCTEADENSG